MSYVPKPLTHAHAIYSWLLEQPEGFACHIGAIARAIKLKSSAGIGPTILPLLNAGLLVCEKRRGGKDPSLYRLGRRISLHDDIEDYEEDAKDAREEADCHPFVHKRVRASVADLPRLPTIFDMGARQ